MTIKLNNDAFLVESFNKNTNFTGENISSTGYCAIQINDVNTLNELSEDTIETIQIINENNNNEIIYNSTNLNCRIASMEEYLSGDRMIVNLHFIF